MLVSVLGLGLARVALAQAAPAPEEDDEAPGVELVAARAVALDIEATGVDARGELSLVLLEAPDRDMPLELRLEPGPVAVDQDRLGWSAVADPLALQPRVRATFTAPSQPGTYAIEGSVTYWVCSERWCRRKHGRLRWTVPVDPG